jgi:hypothetical protein
MIDKELLKRLPKDHYTTHLGKTIKVGELIQLLEDEENKYNNGDVSRQTTKRRVQKVSRMRKK